MPLFVRDPVLNTLDRIKELSYRAPKDLGGNLFFLKPDGAPLSFEGSGGRFWYEMGM